MNATSLAADAIAALSPVRLSNMELYSDGFRTIEVVCDDDDVAVLVGDPEGGDLTTLNEPGRFAQTWARLAPHLVGLAFEVRSAPADKEELRHEIALHLSDGKVLRWTGHGERNDVYQASAAFGMNEDRTYSDIKLVQVRNDHPMFTAALGDWP